jgi:CubicO group peptidase (beta-lactamase class C family)
LDQTVARREIPAAVLLVAHHGQALPPYAVGQHTLSPDAPAVSPDAIFLVASVTKPVVVSAVMLLVERGGQRCSPDVCSHVTQRGKDAV